MNEAGDDWRQRYQEVMLRQKDRDEEWTQRLDLYRRALVRSSLAAEGSDPGVDRTMQALRQLLRQGSQDSELASLVDQLEKVVLHAEQRRTERVRSVEDGLQALAAALLQLPLPAALRRELKAFEREIPQALIQSAALPALLERLVALQQQAVSHAYEAPSERAGLWQRLLRSSSPQPVEPLSEAPDDGHGRRPARQEGEPSYSSVASRIEGILLRMLDNLDIPAVNREQADALRKRLLNGLNWYELVPVLDDLVTLIVTSQDQPEFERYLVQLNERLSQFQENLHLARDGFDQAQHQAMQLEGSLREQVSDLHHSVSEAHDLKLLQQDLDQRLDSLLQVIDQQQEVRDLQGQQGSLHFQQMLDRVTQMEHENHEFQQLLEEQKQLALRDALTGLPNRMAWNERLAQELQHWQGSDATLLLAVLDIDHFKRINDGYGHLAGDRVLKIIAGELSRRLRPVDFVARYGGEEFVILLPDTTLEQGYELLQQVCAGITACPFHFKGEPVSVTASAGLTAFRAHETTEQAFERADQALYRAKEGGRNRIELG